MPAIKDEPLPPDKNILSLKFRLFLTLHSQQVEQNMTHSKFETFPEVICIIMSENMKTL